MYTILIVKVQEKKKKIPMNEITSKHKNTSIEFRSIILSSVFANNVADKHFEQSEVFTFAIHIYIVPDNSHICCAHPNYVRDTNSTTDNRGLSVGM